MKYTIEVSYKSGGKFFNQFTRDFQNDLDANCEYSSESAANADMDAARAAWNEYDMIAVVPRAEEAA